MSNRRRSPWRLPTIHAVVVAAVLVAGCSYTLQELTPTLPANAQSTIVYAADGTEIVTLHAEENRTDLTLDRIPAHLQNAVIAIEDERFWLHHGVDLRAIARAVRSNAASGGITEGGSTITQQLVKNLLLDTEQTLDRKVQEAVLAWQFEQRYTKERILELYLNTVYFGNGAYGVSAAAREYFDLDVTELTVAQSALLAGLIQAPGRYDPYDAPEEAVARRDTVLERMHEQLLLDDAAYEAAVAEPLELAPDVPILEERYAAGHFVEEVKRFVLEDPRFGRTPSERRQLLFTGGLRIHTTIDLRMQAAAEAAVAEILPDPAVMPEAAVVSVEPSTGYVRAMVGGRDFFGQGEAAKYNLAMGKGRPTGSSFKPLVLAAALQYDIPLATQFPAPGSMSLTYGDPPQVWVVGNYGEGGPGVPVDLAEATVRSYNTVFAQLILAVGTDRAVDTAEAMGITTPLERFPSAVLGANDVQPLEMAVAYATLANRGVTVPPVFVTSIETSDGRIVYEHQHTQHRALSPEVADEVTTVLEQVVTRGTGTAARLPRPAAGKTGTGQAWRDAWFCGYTPQLATAVWVGFPGDQVSMVPPRTPIRVTGGSYPARIWGRFMTAAVEPLPVVAFPTTTAPPPVPTTEPPPRPITTGPPQSVPAVTGLPVSNAENVLLAAGFRIARVDVRIAGGPPPGTVIAQSPAQGTPVGLNGVVTIEVAA